MIDTTDPTLQSFITVASDSGFPIQNLPYGVCNREGCCNDGPFAVVAIGEYVLNLARLEEYGYFDKTSLIGKSVFAQPTLNDFMSLGSIAWREAREVISQLLCFDNPKLRDNADLRNAVFYRQSEVEMPSRTRCASLPPSSRITPKFGSS